jgi:Entner-Doudoroff aldolase
MLQEEWCVRMIDLLNNFKVIPVVVLNDENDAKNKLSALAEGGILIAEITFRTQYALEGIKYAIKNFPQVLIGAGTVINEKQCEDAIKCGCKFIVSPGFSNDVALLCKKNDILYIPGCVTPTEIMEAINIGINIIKFFPAQLYGGLKAINDLGSVFSQIQFVPTGGINNDNLKEYLLNKHVKAVGGSWIMKGDVVKNCHIVNDIINSLS